MMVEAEQLQQRYLHISEEARRLAGHDVSVVAVTKTFPVEIFDVCQQAGIRTVGENRVQEARSKQTELGERSLLFDWHLIGPLQAGNARHVPGHFSLVHAVSSSSTLKKLNNRQPGSERLRWLIQLNLTGEESKSGISESELPAFLEESSQYEHLQLCGLMTMGPTSQDKELTGRVFERCARLREEWSGRGYALEELSMGMSGDWQEACRYGSTLIRVGTALFGERPGY